MSGKKQGWFGRKKVSMKEAASAPRTMEEINKEYSETVGKVGQTQYLVYVYTKELEQANSRLLSLNQEASARQVLDKNSAQTETEETGAANEQA